MWMGYWVNQHARGFRRRRSYPKDMILNLRTNTFRASRANRVIWINESCQGQKGTCRATSFAWTRVLRRRKRARIGLKPGHESSPFTVSLAHYGPGIEAHIEPPPSVELTSDSWSSFYVPGHCLMWILIELKLMRWLNNSDNRKY